MSTVVTCELITYNLANPSTFIRAHTWLTEWTKMGNSPPTERRWVLKVISKHYIQRIALDAGSENEHKMRDNFVIQLNDMRIVAIYVQWEWIVLPGLRACVCVCVERMAFGLLGVGLLGVGIETNALWVCVNVCVRECVFSLEPAAHQNLRCVCSTRTELKGRHSLSIVELIFIISKVESRLIIIIINNGNGFLFHSYQWPHRMQLIKRRMRKDESACVA